MSLDSKTQVVKVAPRISKDEFGRILQEGGSPAASEAAASYEAVVGEKVDPLFALAIFHHESQFGQTGVCATHATKSPGNTRSTTTGVGEIITAGSSGKFVKYPSWPEGFRDLAHRLVEPNFEYAKRGLTTVEQILPVWAPVGDGKNKPEKYIAAVVEFMNGFAQAPGPSVVLIKETGKHLGGDFLAFWHQLGEAGGDLQLRTLGFPITEEFQMSFQSATGEHKIQLFERGGLIKEPANPEPWDVHTLKIEQLLEAHHFARENGLFN